MPATSLHSRRKLRPSDAKRFACLEPGLFVELAQVVCAAGVLPRKELHECWQMGVRVHQEFPSVLRVVDVAAGHGLLAWVLVLLARAGETPISRTAVALDVTRPKSASVLSAAITARWPNLAGAVHYAETSIDAVVADYQSSTLFVAAHACGSLSDRLLLTGIESRNPVAIMPCCHSLRKQSRFLATLAQATGLPHSAVENAVSSAAQGGQAKAIDQFRMEALLASGYEVRQDAIQLEVTAFNRIIMGVPPIGAPNLRRSERVADEKAQLFNVSNPWEAEVMSRRPSREWMRFFDLSYWVESETIGQRIAGDLGNITSSILARSLSVTPTISVRDQYLDPASRRLAFTYRVELRSVTEEITKVDATQIRRKLCDAVEATVSGGTMRSDVSRPIVQPQSR